MARFLLSVPLLAFQAFALSQYPLGISDQNLRAEGQLSEYHASKPSKLHGRFLHITDVHADFHYEPGSKTGSSRDCHSGSGDAGYLGSPGTDCDTPVTLINATFQWIQDNLKDSIDFVVWTGDTARHDSDEDIPRTEEELVELNEFLVDKFIDTFSKSDGRKGKRRPQIPIVPTIGNNDIMPHNILKEGPNGWTKKFSSIWDKFIPEEQRHTFVEGGWFYVEVIPDKLAVFSLNTLYFFDSNKAVDGCEDKSEPGYEHMEWLRVQLQFIRDRNMKAILMGHVPPARAGSKQNWDESCWQKYTLWLRQYRDVIVGSVYGHMNIDHFMFQDSHDLKIGGKGLHEDDISPSDDHSDVSIQSRAGYLEVLRSVWAKLPSPSSSPQSTLFGADDFPNEVDSALEDDVEPLGKKSRKKYHKRIGGPWAERYSLSLVSPSIIPNYFPTLRVIEYNVSGLENAVVWSDISDDESPMSPPIVNAEVHSDDEQHTDKKSKKKKKGKKKKPSFKIPEPPSWTAPPGPAYSNQPLTWLSYTQYFANLTKLESAESRSSNWREYRLNKGKGGPPRAPDFKGFRFEVEYDTKDDKVYKLKDMTVKSYMALARRIASKKPKKEDLLHSRSNELSDANAGCHGGNGRLENTSCTNGKGSPGVTQEETTIGAHNKVWQIFLRRAFVGYFNDEDLKDLLSSA